MLFFSLGVIVVVVVVVVVVGLLIAEMLKVRRPE